VARSVGGWAAGVLVALALAAPSQATADVGTFTNPGLIEVADGAFNESPPPDYVSGKGSPYPSTISVSGLAGPVTDVNVTLRAVDHSNPDDLDVLLVGPGGQQIEILSDAGDSSSLGPEQLPDLTFDDQAAGNAPDNGAISGGAYKPTNHFGGLGEPVDGSDVFPSPAPGPPRFSTLADAFNGTDSNGTWQLYVADDQAQAIGTIRGGWSLQITTGPASPTASFTSSRSPILRNAAGIWLSGRASMPPRGRSIVAYKWDFDGNGSVDETCGADTPAAVHQYARGGVHHVVLTVEDSGGGTAFSSQDVRLAAGKARGGPRLSTISACLTQTTEQPSTADCIRTFQFNLVDVNARSSNCFEIKTILPTAHGAHQSALPFVPLKALLGYHATIKGPVAINGLAIPLPKDAKSEYDTVTGSVGLGRQNLDLGSFRLGHVDLDTNVTEFGPKAVHHLGAVSLSGLPAIGGLGVGGEVTVDFIRHQTRVNVTVKLPNVFSLGAGKRAEGSVGLIGDNTHAFRLDNGHLHVDTLFLGPLEIDQFDLDYQSQGNVWNGGADLKLPVSSPFVLHARPPPPDNGIGLAGGGFDHAGATVEFSPESAPQLFPGVFLTKIGVSIGARPTRFRGVVQLRAANIVQVDGQLILVLASPEQPYTFPAEGAGQELAPIVGHTFESTAFAAGGAISIATPIGNLPLASAYILYEYPAYFEFSGGFGVDLAVFSVNGRVGGFVDLDQGRFNVEGNLDACIADLACLNVASVVSSKGIAACGSIKVIFARVTAGVGYRWGDGVDVMFGSCDIGPYRAQRTGGRASAGGTSFHVGAGLPSEMLKVEGSGDAPKITVHGPHGETYSTGDDRSRVDPHFAFVREAANHTTYFGLLKPPAGTWTVTQDAGSAPIASLAVADGLPPPSVHGHVSGHGARRILHYKLKRLPGQRVIFAEQGADAYSEIGRTAKAHGTLRFRPSLGTGGKRKIIAIVEHNGLATQRIEVTRFHAPRSRLPRRPQGLQVKHTGSRLVVRWHASRGAVRYGVTVDPSGAARRMILTHKHKLTIHGVPGFLHGSVSVSGLRLDNRFGQPSRERFKSSRKHRDRHGRH
jgi:subtilisin-like proprotein convertase family protein